MEFKTVAASKATLFTILFAGFVAVFLAIDSFTGHRIVDDLFPMTIGGLAVAWVLTSLPRWLHRK
jgi:hypothetical protein